MSESSSLPYELADVEVDKPLKRPQQIEALLSSGVAWSELAPLVFMGTSDGSLHCFVPANPNGALSFLRWHATYKKLYHASAQFLDAWGVYLTVTDAKLALYTLPLHSNPHVEGGTPSSADDKMVVVLDETKHTQLVAVHDEARVVCVLSKSHTLRVFDWTVNRSLELRAQHELAALLAASSLIAPGVLPVQKMALLGDSHVLLAFKKDWCVVHLDSGTVLEPADEATSPPFTVDTISSVVTLPPRHGRPGHRTLWRDALITCKHHALRIRIVDAPLSAGPRKRVAVDRVVEYNVTPRSATYHHPYVLWDLHDKLAVYNSATMKPVQTLPIKGMYSGGVVPASSMQSRDTANRPWPLAFVSVAAPFSVQVATMTPIATQLRRSLDAGRLEDAVVLTELCPDDASLADDEASALYAAFARDLFRRKQFDAAMTYFRTANVAAIDVLRLFPRDLLPRVGLQAVAEPTNEDAASALDGEDLVHALVALVEFLRQRRESPTAIRFKGAVSGVTIDRELQLIDTVLAKCLVLLTEREGHRDRAQQELLQLVQQENHCDVGETEVFLRAHLAFEALLHFYATRKFHRKALELLDDLERSAIAREAEKPGTTTRLKGLKTPSEYRAMTTAYLRRLGQKKADLVFEFSRRVLQVSPALGLSIFTQRDVRIGKEDIDPVQIVQHLKTCQVDASQAPVVAAGHESQETALPLTESRYLAIEYVTQVVNDTDRRLALPTRLHDDAVYLLLDAIHAYVQQTKHQSASAVTRLTSRVSLQRGHLGQLRRKLLAFLESPRAQYHPERMLSRTPPEMIDERAALLARLGRHHEVLQLYALELRDAALAESYCNRCFEAKQADTSIYSTLLRLYLRPTLPANSGSLSSLSSSPPKPLWQRSTSLHLPAAATKAGASTAGPTLTTTHSVSSEAVAAAVNILNRYAERIDVPTALELLPADVPVASLASFFARVLERQVERHRNGQVKKQLAKIENFRVREKLTVHRKNSVTVWSSHCCEGCGKKLGVGTFVRLPNGGLLHYACQPAP
ncbi:hypothetical protein P43SY_005785 [Pythium insidiosum]|uniref:CNH domain-containing protein n=1 Tax=Pythium insidiosum TaxID=114742 RepID=A0AAD5MCA1_PYTIN|nr:hypothetical protein P43SY_005785 [Pythium insidiosum]